MNKICFFAVVFIFANSRRAYSAEAETTDSILEYYSKIPQSCDIDSRLKALTEIDPLEGCRVDQTWNEAKAEDCGKIVKCMIEEGITVEEEILVKFDGVVDGDAPTSSHDSGPVIIISDPKGGQPRVPTGPVVLGGH